MQRWQRTSLAACAALTAYMLAYVGTDYAKVPRLFYFPLTREWRLAVRAPGLPMGYVGLWAWAVAAAVVVGAAVYGGLAFRARPISARGMGLAAAWTLTAVLLAAGYYTWNNWP